MTFHRSLALASTATAALIASASGVAASSHREAPSIAQQPAVDNTDFYLFRSYEQGRGANTVMIANVFPSQAPYGGPNYFALDPRALYQIHIDNDGDAVEDITFTFRFSNPFNNNNTPTALDIDGESVPIPLRAAGPIGVGATDAQPVNNPETYTLQITRGDRRSGTAEDVTRAGGNATFEKPLDYAGTKTFPDYDAYAGQFIYDIDIPGCTGQGRVFVGQRAEGFAVNLGPVFDLVNFVPIEGDSAPGAGDGLGFPQGITQDRAANDDLVGESNVTSLALEIPTDCLVDNDPIIGAWTTTSLPQGLIEDPSPTYQATEEVGGAFVQQSRLSAPLVNELVIGLPDKDLFNAAEPTQDSALALYVTNPTLPALVDLLFRDAVNQLAGTNFTQLAPTNIPRDDLVAAFLTGIAGLNQPNNVVGAEMMRLNTAIAPTGRAAQSAFGVVGEDLAGFPNGRRPGDDVVDIALRVVMGALCHDVPLGAELGIAGAVEDTPTDLINLGFCLPEDAQVGNQPFTDGAPLSALDFDNTFPFLTTPIPGAN